MRKIFFIFVLAIFLSGCKQTINDNNQDIDTIPPLFLETVNGELSKIRHSKGDTINLLNNIKVIDNLSEEVSLSIVDYGGYDKDQAGKYKISIQAQDEAGNISIINRTVEVYYSTTITYDALVINGQGINYSYNDSTSLNFSSSGALFRKNDIIQVMEKEFFVEQYIREKDRYTNNGKVPYFPHGVVLLLDSDMRLKHLRIAPNIEVNENGETTLATIWNNSLDNINGGGLFKEILSATNHCLPNGGYIIFAPSYGDDLSKNYLIKNLYYSDYQGGNLSINDYNVDINSININFESNYKEIVEMTNGEIINGVVKKKMIYDGIPLTIYYKNDNKPKKLLYFFHGFAGNREIGIMGRGEILANQGYYVIAIDAYLHGEREPDFFKTLSYGEKQQEIVNVIIQTAKDAQHLYHKYFNDIDGVDTTKVYAYGVSMGAGVAFYLATIMDELKTFASIVGSPSLYEFYKYKQTVYQWEVDDYFLTNLESYQEIDPLINYEKLRNKNIFMGCGTLDTTVPLIYAKELFEKLNLSNIVYKEYDTNHSSTPEMQEDAYKFLQNN